jgi:hypothetical protein
MSQQKPPRATLYLNDDDKTALDEVKQHYGITSTAAALRRALNEHAASLREPKPAEKRVTLSRRVY